MIEFRVLGALELRNEAGDDVRSVLAQPRRVALLARLVLRSAVGPERRDTLLGVFWPEADAAHARGALRNAVHFLRRSLGADVIESRSDEELRVSSERVWCDAVAFEVLLDEGRREEALELYRGDLLEGFFISDARAFEEWLEEERARLCRRAVEAASALADVAEEEGQPALAAHHARRALALSREDEAAARRLIRLLWRAGDRAGALQAYEEFVARLAAAYGVEPSPETRELVEGLRAGAAAAEVSVPKPIAHPIAEASADAAPAVTGGREAGPGHPAERAPTTWWRRPVLALLVPLLLAALAVGLLRPGQLPEAAPASDVVAVLPFSFRGSQEIAFLGEGMVSLLSANLQGAGELRSVDPRLVLSRVEAAGGRASDIREARALADRLGANLFVVGDVMEMEGRLRISAALYPRRERGLAPPKEATVEGGAEAVFDLVDELTRRLLEDRAGSGLARVAVRTTRSMEALKAYLQGEAEYRAGRYAGAVEAFERAVSADPAFSLAHYRLSNAAGWVGRYELAKEAADRALHHAHRLSRQDSLLVAAWRHHRFNLVELAEPLYRRVVALKPDDLEAWFQLGEILFHWGPTLGRPTAESRLAFERVLALQPDHASALIHLARIAAQERRTWELDTLAARGLALRPAGPWALELETLRAVASGDAERRDRALRAAVEADESVGASVLESVGAFSQELGTAARLARLLAASGRSDARRAEARLMAVEVEAARGRWRVAQRELEGAGELPEQRILEYRAMLATLPFVPIADAEMASLRGALMDTARTSSRLPPPDDPIWRGQGEYPPLLWDGLHLPRRLYLVASLGTRLGDGESALRAAEMLELLRSRGEREGGYLARLVRARLAFLRGEPARALELLGEPRVPPTRTYETLVDYSRGFERYLRAQLLEAAGRPREALRWYATFPTPTAHDLPYLAPSWLARARLHEALEERAEAARAYERFMELWAQADPELQPQVGMARERLVALRE